MTTISDEQFISTIYDRLLIEDDTEESVSGSDYHLAAIFALYDVLLRYVNSSEEVSMNYSDGATQHPDRVPAILRVQAPLSPLCGGPETCCLPR